MTSFLRLTPNRTITRKWREIEHKLPLAANRKSRSGFSTYAIKSNSQRPPAEKSLRVRKNRKRRAKYEFNNGDDSLTCEAQEGEYNN